eukprot:gene31409-37967_t
MASSVCFLLLLVALASCFMAEAFYLQGEVRANRVMYMKSPKPSGLSNTREGKAKILARTKILVDNAFMIISAPVEGVSKEQIDLLKKAIPRATKASVIKNALLRVSLRGTPFEALGGKIRDETIYFFVPEGHAKDTYEGYQKWRKEAKREEPEFDMRLASFEGVTYQGAEIEGVVKLPTRKELYTKLARTLKSVPNKLGRTLKSVNSKVVRAVVAVKDKKAKEEANV